MKPRGALLGDDPLDVSSLLTTSPHVEDTRDARADRLPRWLVGSRDKLAKLLRYGSGTYAVFRQLSSVRDERRRPQIPTSDVLRSLCFTAMLRIPSLNSLEGWLKRPG